MRIEQIRFKNINSLAGEWSINFQDDKLALDHVMLICGPTGSGKTTILDAISLALYGCTPRTNDIRKGGANSGGVVMTKGAWECFADIVYSTSEGRYRAYWHQHRANKDPAGQLQLVKREFSPFPDRNNELVSGSQVLEQVEKTTGMTFEQFTRSVLLAQGNFAKFLESTPEKRAPLLAEITGLDRYEKISRAVYARSASESKALEMLTAKQKGVETLSPDDRAAIERQRDDLESSRRNNTDSKKQLEGQSKWHADRKEAEKRLAGARKKKEAADRERDDFQKRENVDKRLRDDDNAATLDVRRNLLIHQRDERKKCAEELSDAEQRRPSLEKNANDARVAASGAEAAYNDLERKMREERRPLFTEVRNCDDRIKERTSQLRDAEKACGDMKKKADDEACDLETKNTALESACQTRGHWTAWAKNHARDDALPAALSGITAELKALRDKNSAVEKGKGEWDKAADKLKTAKADVGKWTNNCNSLQKQLEKKKAETAAIRGKLDEILAGSSLDDIKTRLLELSPVQTDAQTLSDALDQLARNPLDDLEKKLSDIEDEEKTASAKVGTAVAAVRVQEKNLERLRAELIKAISCASAEQMRSLLREGEPCPCCGATHHPWAGGNGVPDKNAAQERYDKAQDELGKKNSDFNQLQNELNVLSSKKIASRALIDDARTKRDELLKRVNHCRETMVAHSGSAAMAGNTGLPAADAWPAAESAALSAVAKAALDQVSATVTSLRSKLKEAEPLWKEHEKKRKEAEQLGKDVGDALSRKQLLEVQEKHAQQELEKMAESLRTTQSAADDARAAMIGSLRAYGFGEGDLDDLNKLQATLEQRAEAWEKAAGELDKARGSVVTLWNEINEITIPLTAHQEQLEQLEADKKKVSDDLQKLQDRRQELFGGKVVDTESDREEKELRTAAEARLDAHTRMESAKGTLSALDEHIGKLKDELSKRTEDIKTPEAEFIRNYRALGFLSEDEVTRARLDAAKRTWLETNRDTYKNACDIAGAIEKEAEKALKKLDETDPGATEEDVAIALEEIRRAIADQDKQLGALNQQLEDDKKSREKFKAIQDQIDRQRKVSGDWNLLDTLIGSASGEKFSRFAQGVTLGVLVRLANKALSNLMPRFRLTQSKDNALAFNIVDTEMFNEERPVDNLSGGEKFLVSLSLALGLSNLSRGKVRIDTLFLDEGFGTLDEPLRDRTVDRLKDMGIANNGLIGIISHMPSLEEHISTRIRVRQGPHGLSTLHNEGCDCVSGSGALTGEPAVRARRKPGKPGSPKGTGKGRKSRKPEGESPS